MKSTVTTSPDGMSHKTVSHVPRDGRLPTDQPVTLANWQQAPFNRWAFAHANELVPTAVIGRRRVLPQHESNEDAQSAVLDRMVAGLADFLATSHTEAFLVLQHDRVIDERYFGGFGPTDRHLLMSVSKSMCGLTVGRLVDRGLIDTAGLVGDYVPTLNGSAYGDATIQQVLDMTVAVDFTEDYADPGSHVQAQDRVAGWRPRSANDPADTYEFLTTLRKSGEHGRWFQYCSANTDVLAWIIEGVTGRRYADVIASELWSPLGCEDDAVITVDPGGFAFANGGIACTARDLSRLGRVMLGGGLLEGQRVVPAAWAADTIAGGNPAAAAGSAYQTIHPNGSYRNQWWVTGNERGNYYAVGIHGQYVWIDPPSNSVIVKFSSWPGALTEGWSQSHVEVFQAIGEALTPA